MTDIRNLRALGQPWCVIRDLGIVKTAEVLVAPKAAVHQVGGIDSAPLAVDSDRIIICGFFYDYVGANTEGFSLFWRETSSHASPGGTTDTVIIESRATTAVTQVSASCDSCFIPGAPGAYNDGVSPTVLSDPAELLITNDANVTGSLVVWGVITAGNEPFVPNHNIYGSPFDLDAAAPHVL